MRLAFVVALACLLPATGAAAQTSHPLATTNALRAGCAVQQVHTPAGKPVHNLPVVRCRDVARATATAARDATGRDRSPATGR